MEFLFPEEANENKEEVQPKEKKKKKLSPAALKKLQAKAAEEARQQLIKQKQEYLRQTKNRVQSEWERNHAKAQIYENEFQERQKLLEETSQKLAGIEDSWDDYIRDKRKYADWEQYMKCDGLPNPSSVSEMNRYIFVWTEVDTNPQMSYCMKKTDEVMELLKGLEKVIGDPGPDHPPYFLKDMKELRCGVRDLLQKQIDKATFYLFSRIETDMVSINVTTSKYFASCPHFLMSLWAELITPIPSSKEKEVRQPVQIVFEEVQVSVVIPVSLLDVHKVMRAMWLNYDHWSDKCRTYDCPPLPTYFSQSVYELFLAEYDRKIEIMSYREHLEHIMKRKIAAVPPEPSVSQEILAWDSEPQRALSEEIMFRECEEEDNMGKHVKEILNEFEVNLRERTFLGELLLVEVLHQPPQAQCLRLKHCVTLRKKPPMLQPVEFYVKYPPPEESLEEDEDQEKKQAENAKHLEELKKKLVTVQLQPHNSVLWFEQPQLANWDPVHGYWSTEDIHDTVYDEEEEKITFKTGRLGLLGLHVTRYCNFPYEDWVFEPNDEGGVNFFLKTAKTELLFKIKEGKVCLATMGNAPGKALNWMLGKYYPVAELTENLKKGGLDVFPGPDASSYIDEVQSKHFVIERNIYQVWGLFSKSFRFKRSKFNQLAGRANIVFQAQEIYKNHQVDFCLIHACMCSCYVLDIKEESDNYSPEKAPEMEKCVNLYTMLQTHCTGNARRLLESTCQVLIQTVKNFLISVRPISFS